MSHNNHMLRICLVGRSFYPKIGGNQRQIQRLARVLIEKNVQLFLVTERYDRNLKKQQVVDRIPVSRISQTWWIKEIKFLRRFLYIFWVLSLFCDLWKKRKDFDIIHVYFIDSYTYAAVLTAKLLKKKVVLREGTGNQGERAWFAHWGGNIRAWLIKKADRIVCVSQEQLNSMKEICIDQSKLRYIPNGIETDKWLHIEKTSNRNLKRENSVKKTGVICGRLDSKVKGIDIMLKAWKTVISEYSRALLTILGDGREKAVLNIQAKELGINRNVSFKGFVNNVQDFLVDADVFVLPSISEGMPNALLEGMSIGIPCIVTPVGGIPDIIEHGKNGLIVPVEDHESLADAIITLFRNDSYAEKLGKAARETIETKFSMDSVAEKYIALYRELIE